MPPWSYETRLQIALATIRISIGVFFLVWSLEKILAPEVAQRVFSTFYFVADLPPEVSIALGIAQTAIVVAFLLGLFRTWTYGTLLVMHAFSVISTWERLANPYEPPNHLFWAGVPVLGALFALFLLRDADTALSPFAPRRTRPRFEDAEADRIKP